MTGFKPTSYGVCQLCYNPTTTCWQWLDLNLGVFVTEETAMPTVPTLMLLSR